MATDSDILKDAKEAFDQTVEAESSNREEALDDLKFARLGEQWPEAIRKQREAEGRPCLTLNRLPAFIRQVVNDSRQNKPSIKTHPVDDAADPETAEIFNGLIRNIEYTSNADVAYDTALDFAVTASFGYWRVKIDYAHDDTFDMDILIDRISNPFSVYGDPHSTAADSSDWNRAFVTEMLARGDFRRKYKGAQEVNWDTLGYDQLKAPWVEKDSLMVAEFWVREEVARTIVRLADGSIMDAQRYAAMKAAFDALDIAVIGDRQTRSWKVIQHLMTGAEVLESNDWAGKYIPIVPVYGDEVNIEGKRYLRSLIRDAKDPARMFNYWRTTSTELVALAPKAPWVGAKGSFNSDARWGTANTQTHQTLEYDPVQNQPPPQRQPFAGPPAGALQEALNAADDMKSIMGIYDASLGARSNETSGRAILARQREGDVSTFHFIDNLSRAIRHTGRILIDLIPKVYTGERIIRILGPEGGDPMNVPLNTPVKKTPEGSYVKASPEEHADPNFLTKVFNLAAGKYDLTVETGPSFTTRREEAAAQMVEFIRANPAAAPLIGDLLAKNLDWPGAEEIAKRLQAMLPPQVKGQDPAVMQLQQQMQQMDANAREAVQSLSQQLAALKQDKALEAAKLKIDAYGKETDRIKATSAGMQPEQVQALVIQTLQQVLSSPDILPGAPPPQGVPIPPAPPEPTEPPQGGFFMPGDGQITNP